ncbi:MAG: F0F1 ATP synthase subunit delta [Candidatus Kerfeldbacteria bacterium]|nr:F0F1 ATP synthase subunit delta [Candidatus Kerfeldbacteria bacterium]
MKITAAQYAQSWYQILRESKDRDAALKQLLDHLHVTGKLKLLPEIVRLIGEIEQKETGMTKVTITSAHELSKAIIEELLQKTLGHAKADVATLIEPELIGGARVRTQDEQWDLSVHGQLNAMKNQVINNH